MKNMKKRSLRRIFAGILGIGILLTGAAPCAAAAYGYDEYGDPIVTATPVPDSQSGQVTQAAPVTIHRRQTLIPLTDGLKAQMWKPRLQFSWM